MSFRNIIVISLATVISLCCWSLNTKSRYASLFAEALTKIDDYALKEVDERTLYESAMRGMLRSLDQHSDFFSGQRYVDFEEQMKGEFGGVGMYFDLHPQTGDLTITATLPGTPAFEAGLRPGDVIQTIDGQDVQGISRRDAISRMRGPVGSSVDLNVARESRVLPVTLVRGNIPIQSVLGDTFSSDGRWNFVIPEDSRIAYINITDFAENTDKEFAEALAAIEQCQGLIVDLRSNSGGYLPQAVSICDMFLDKKVKIVEVKGRGGKLMEPPHMATERVAYDPNKPLVILIDRHSASASEIVAACMQDHRRATIIGEPSYGKGTVQTVIPLERNRSSMKITTATYWSPSGRNIDQSNSIANGGGHGVHPDRGFDFKFTEEEVAQIDILRYRRQFQVLDIFATQETNDSEDSQESDNAPRWTQDPVLQQAIDFLKSVLDRNQTT